MTCTFAHTFDEFVVRRVGTAHHESTVWSILMGNYESARTQRALEHRPTLPISEMANFNGFNREAVGYRSRGREPTVEREMLVKPRSGDTKKTRLCRRVAAWPVLMAVPWAYAHGYGRPPLCG